MAQTAPPPTPASPAGTRLDPALIKLALILVVGAVAPQLDTTVVNVGLHTVAAGLGTGVGTVQWVATAYLLALGVTVPLNGWLLGRWGGRRVWLGALVLFLIGSVLAGAARSAGFLIVFRIVQGAAAGILAPLMLTLLIQAAGSRPLGRLITIVTMVVVAVPIAGPVIGGVIVQWLSWRWLFFVNVPITAAASSSPGGGCRTPEGAIASPSTSWVSPSCHLAWQRSCSPSPRQAALSPAGLASGSRWWCFPWWPACCSPPPSRSMRCTAAREPSSTSPSSGTASS